MQAADFDRRIYRREFQKLLGFGETWFRQLTNRGTLPTGFRDPGGGREFWPASVVQTTLEKMNKQAMRATPVVLPRGCNQKGARKTGSKAQK